MLRGYYTAAAGMFAQSRRQEMLTNNLANANTPGYKADQASLRSFPQMLIAEQSAKGSKTIGGLSTGVYLQETVPKFVQGPLKETGNATDIALLQSNLPINEETGKSGALLFTVQMPDGSLRYTRNGHFTIDPTGNLVTGEGYFVLGSDGQPIQLNSTDFKVNENGQIVQNGFTTGQLDIAYAADPTSLVKEGNGLFRLDGNNGQLPSAIGDPNVTYQTTQGFLEQSNVSIEQAMTDLMMTYRSFEANQKVLQAYDRSMGKAVNEVGKIG